MQEEMNSDGEELVQDWEQHVEAQRRGLRTTVQSDSESCGTTYPPIVLERSTISLSLPLSAEIEVTGGGTSLSNRTQGRLLPAVCILVSMTIDWIEFYHINRIPTVHGHA